jgi:twitching motility two-component system response regulator PilG
MTGSPSRTLRDGIGAALARDFDNAHRLLQRATTENPNDIQAWLWRALASPAPDDAIRCLRRVLVFDPAHGEAQQAVARLLAGQATALAAGGQRAEAAGLAREAADLAPDCDVVWIALASLSEEPQERLDALRRAFDLNPLAQPTRALLRDALLHAGIATAGSNPDAARLLFREASTVDPTDPRVWQAVARMAANITEAVGALRELFTLAPDRPGIRAALKRALAAAAESCAAAGSPDEAAERWREAIALDDQDRALWLGLAAVTRNRDEASRALGRAGLDDPRVAELAARWQTEPEAAPAAPATVPPAVPTPELLTAPPSLAPESPFAAPAADVPESPFTQVSAFAPADPAPFASAPAPEPVAPPSSLESESPFASPPAADPFGAYAPPPPTAISPSMQTSAAAPPSPFTAPPAAAALVPAAPPPAPARPAAAAGTKRTVMVVDDSPTVRKILSMTLERAGYGVVAAADGEAALESLLTTVPDLILLDISMPKLDGYEVCKRVKADARTAHVPVVMLSGKDAFFDKVKGRMAGATEYLTKPFATPVVLAAVERMFEPEAGAVHG